MKKFMERPSEGVVKLGLTRHWLSIPVGLLLAMAACNDESGGVVVPATGSGSAATTVSVFRDPTFDFAALRTFALPDTVIHVAPATGVPLPVSRDFDRTIIDRVRSNFLSRGYTDVGGRAAPTDFVVLVSATASANTLVGAVPNPRGTLIVELLPINQTGDVAWTGVAVALLDGTLSSSDVTTSIDQMFALSPYLRAAP